VGNKPGPDWGIKLDLDNHWAPWFELHNIAEFGRIGLLLFFILSGYLITSVLLRLRDRMESHELSTRQAFKNFYMRRVLRIFPIYLLAILIAAALLPRVRHDFLFHLVFLQNFSALWNPNHPTYSFATHLWSLAVEEQFYLLWAPVVLLLAGRRQLIIICIGAILVALIFKTWCAVYLIDGWTLRLITLGNIDALAIGCLTAIDYRYRLVDWKNGVAYKFKKIASMLVIPILGITICFTEILGYEKARAAGIYVIFYDSLMEIPLWLLLYYALSGSCKLLSNRYLVWIGKKSYGIYVWHEFIRIFSISFALIIFHYRLDYKFSLLSLLIFSSVAFIVATISWNFVEAPILKYKTKWS